jgi:hypothetical protein
MCYYSAGVPPKGHHCKTDLEENVPLEYSTYQQAMTAIQSSDTCVKYDRIQLEYMNNRENKKRYTIDVLKKAVTGLIERGKYIKPKGGLSKLKKDDLINILLPIYVESGARINAFVHRNIRQCFQTQYSRILRESVRYRSQCVNTMDFYTLEPIENIPINQFFAFTEGGVYYGFNLFSLKTLCKYRCRIKNPFTNIYITDEVLDTFFSLLQLTKILYPDIVDQNQVPLEEQASPREAEEAAATTEVERPQFTTNLYPDEATLTPRQREVMEQVQQKRELSIDRRIEEVFIEMDHLGYYTDSSWFKELSPPLLNRLARCIRNYWDQEAHLMPDQKYNVCCLGSHPFYGISLQQSHTFSPAMLREVCLIAIENLVYTGVDVTNRKDGVLHFILQLMKISEPANRAFSWLY